MSAIWIQTNSLVKGSNMTTFKKLTSNSTREEFEIAIKFLDINTSVIKSTYLEEMLFKREQDLKIPTFNIELNSKLAIVFNNLIDGIIKDYKKMKIHYSANEVSEQYKLLGLYITPEELRSLYYNDTKEN